MLPRIASPTNAQNRKGQKRRTAKQGRGFGGFTPAATGRAQRRDRHIPEPKSHEPANSVLRRSTLPRTGKFGGRIGGASHYGSPVHRCGNARAGARLTTSAVLRSSFVHSCFTGFYKNNFREKNTELRSSALVRQRFSTSAFLELNCDLFTNFSFKLGVDAPIMQVSSAPPSPIYPKEQHRI